MGTRRWWIHGITAGLAAGVLAQTLVLRVNPELEPSTSSLLLGLVLWASWGAALVGCPLAMLTAAWLRLRGQRAERWSAPWLLSLTFAVAAALSWVNADLHREFLSRSGCRTLAQDAVVWLVCAFVTAALGMAVERRRNTPLVRAVYVCFVLAVPVTRLLWQPTPQRQPLEVDVRPLGRPQCPLVVCGIEGLDSKILLVHAADSRYPTLMKLQTIGAWGPLRPFRPYLRRSHWTAVATGTMPGRNGVKDRWGWRMPLLFDDTLRLLPWTPQGARLILPWGLAERVTPPPSTIPPLWERVAVSGVETEVLEWPGIWGPSAKVTDVGSIPDVAPDLDPSFQASLEEALSELRGDGGGVAEAIARDNRLCSLAADSLQHGVENVWVHLQALGTVRRSYEPVRPLDTAQREVLELELEILDQQIARLLGSAGPGSLIAIVSPYGFESPTPIERVRRILGIGGSWRASPESCPDGLLILVGDAIAAGERFPEAALPDLAPTLCYLLGLPAAQYMEGRVLVDVVNPEFLAGHPLRVVD
jgi:hypothetical protein